MRAAFVFWVVELSQTEVKEEGGHACALLHVPHIT